VKRPITILKFVLCFTIIVTLNVNAQEVTNNTQQQLELIADTEMGETEDDTYLVELEQFRKSPININIAEIDELKQLMLLSDLQIINLIAYRNLLGKFVNIYELQAIPSWDINTIKKILPYITISSPISVMEDFIKRFRGGEHSLLFRIAQVLEKSKGFDQSTAGTKYLGSPQRILFRYRYVYKNLLQYGLLGDKDAGEQFFKGKQNLGFDFYSAHLFARNLGIVKAFALGDFTVNMGQGLIQWQSLAFKKSLDIAGTKRQSATLRPYSSAGEYYFHRGAGITLKKKKIESTLFFSFRNLSVNFVADTVNQEDYISSFLTMGYHRTDNENQKKNNLLQTSYGGNIVYRSLKGHIGLNGIYYGFSASVNKRNEPYNLYAISGKSWNNYSVDYSYTFKNIHFFGEAAIDKKSNTAFVNGLMMSVDPRVDISFLQRTISKAYQAVNGNAFTENTYPTNETGFYIGISIRPNVAWRIDAYADLYKFPWLKYLVDAPSSGKDYQIQLTYSPSRQVEVYSRFKSETKQANQPDNATVTNFIIAIPKQNWRTQISYKINNSITLRNRVEMLWYNHNSDVSEKGFLGFIDFLYKPMLSPMAAALRLQYFETNSYNSRLYAYENDVLYSYSIPVFYGKGFRYYLNLNYDINKQISCWLRWAQYIYKDRNSIGTGLDQIQGNKKSELKFQIRWIFSKK